jgi:iron complex outermembrane recepter protein
MQWKHALMASSAMLVAALGTSAHAQTKPGTTAAASNTIEELVVTAEKRAQNLQDVPVAISAFTSERRDLIGITTVTDLTNFTPGLEYNAQNDRNTLRGVGRNTNVHAAEGSVAQYSDGIYTSSTVEAGKTPLFVDRIEVLRGPQGTLYGRNSIGGAINIISKRPTEDWYAEVRAQLQNYDHTILEGAMSGPTMIPGVQFRVAAGWEKQTEGWLKNTVPGQPDAGNIIDQKIWEAQLKFHFNDNFDGWMKLSGIDWHNQSGGPGSKNTFTKTNFPAGTLTPGLGTPSFPNYLVANAGLTPNSGYACLPTSQTGVTNIVTAGGMSLAAACTNASQTDPRKFTSDIPFQDKLTGTTIFASEWTYHFDKMDLKYIAGGTHYHYHLTGPATNPFDTAAVTSFQLPFVSGNTVIPGALGAAGTVDPRYSFAYEEKENWFSNELDLSSSGEGPFQWIVGGYYYDENYSQPTSTQMLDQGAPVTHGPFLTNSLCQFTAFGNPAGACPALAGNNFIYDDRPELEIISKAAFGQIDWQFAEHWKTTLGIRYTEDHKFGQESLRILGFDAPNAIGSPENFTNFIVDLTQLPTVVSGLIPGGPGAPPTPGVSSITTVDPASGFATRHYDNKWAATTGTAGVQWDPDPDTMAYFRYSRGYKAGGFRIGINTTIGASPNTDPEHMNAYEIGLKKDFGRTFQANVAIFYDDYENDQVPISVAATNGGLSQANAIFYNVPKAVTEGFELETTWQPIDHLQVLFNYSYNDAHITNSTGVVDPADPTAVAPGASPIGPLTPCSALPATSTLCDAFTGFAQRGQNLSGQSLPNVPQNKVSLNVNYAWELPGGTLSPSLSYVWRSSQYGSIFDRAYYQSPSYDQWDARVTWKSEDKKYSIIGFVRNITNSVGYEGGAAAQRNAGYVPAHVLGTIPAGGTASTYIPVLEGITSGYTITPPRTYGIELQYRFF